MILEYASHQKLPKPAFTLVSVNTIREGSTQLGRGVYSAEEVVYTAMEGEGVYWVYTAGRGLGRGIL